MTPADHGIVLRRAVPGNHRVPCPRCARGERDTALSVTLEADGWVAHCFRCGWTISARDRGVTRVTSPMRRPVSGALAASAYSTLAPRWADFWARCKPVRGTPAEAYLRARACALPPPAGDLRYHPRAWHWLASAEAPAMVARCTDAVDKTPRTLHFTFLKPDGSDKAELRPPRLMLARHRKAGAVVRLWPDEDVERVLGIAEGIESALSLAWAPLPVWAAIDAGNLGALPVLGGIEELCVAVDRDPAGEAATRALARSWSAAGCTVRLVRPQAGDLNDVARGTYGTA